MKVKRTFNLLIGSVCMLAFFSGCKKGSDYYTQGVGNYPGRPAENFSPTLVPDNDNYRNLARLRPAYHSSSYDYNLTAQLITDGIVTDEVPAFITFTTNQGVAAKNERELVLDHVTGSANSLEGSSIWLEFASGGDTQPSELTSIGINGELVFDPEKPKGWEFILKGSNDGIAWDVLDQAKGSGLPGIETPNPFAMMLAAMPKDSTGKPINPFAGFFGPVDPNEPKPSFTFSFKPPEPGRTIAHVFSFKKKAAYSIYRVELNTRCAKSWEIGDFDFYNKGKQVEMAPSHKFKSAWMSAGSDQEWVYVDLGSESTFDRIVLHWINKAISGTLQVSDDVRNWRDVAKLPGSDDKTDEIPLLKGVRGRFVRVLMDKTASGGRYMLSELEIMGKGGMVAKPKASPVITSTRMDLAGGNWKIQRASQVSSAGESISTVGFDGADWVVATVPGTVLVSYWNAGAVPDPNYGDNQLMISESFFNSDFWYRNEFDVPAGFKNESTFLNFDGINWKADVFVNGKKLGDIKGAFINGNFDVSNFIIPGQKNAVAVLIKKNDNIGCITEQSANSPDKNGGILGGDNPTYHASVGWDWIPTIRGRNIGIWNDVYLTTNGGVTIENPFVSADLPLPDTTSADIGVEVTLKNHLSKAITGIFTGKFGGLNFEEKVTLQPAESRVVKLDASTHPVLHIANPKLWWPKGYGPQNMYDVELSFVADDGSVLDKDAFKSGVREMAYTDKDMILKIYINGRRFIGRGGNWGFPESNLEYRNREYDIAVAYHADMNFTMIRNWVGQTGDEEFYEACDRYGVMVWQDFWLANPVDGPNPNDPEMFLNNAAALIKRIRNHPSMAIYVGRNEGNPPEVIDTALSAMVPALHKGMMYIPNSAFGSVSGGGPYRALPPRDYFLLYGRNKLHSERGMPNVMTYESMKQMLPESAFWPQNSQWGLHDYCLDGAQGAASFNQMIETGFGPADNLKKFTELAQWINYNGYRAMFEGRSQFRQGLLLWMSHSAWPSMVWQTYDYYFEPTAAYFGCKKASEPIHIQWNQVYDDIEVVNLNGRDRKGITARAQIINMDGSVQWKKEKTVDSNEDTTDKLFKLEFPASLSAVHFIRLALTERGKIISENFYWRGIEDGNYRALNDIPKVKLDNNTNTAKSGENWILTTTLRNTTKDPVLMVRLKVVGKSTGARMLPVFFSDNYISLMPGEQRVITMKLKDEDTRGEKPAVEISGFNVN